MTTIDQVEIKAQEGPQTTFLESPADITIYGGAAGGGKTYALLLEPIRHLHNKQFGAVIFRRILKSIKIEGGMWDESQGIYRPIGGMARSGDLVWEWPNGVRITFAGIEHEKDKFTYQGAQITLIEFDQLEEFSKSMFFFMLSRNRSVSGVRPYIRATANPQPGWLAEFLDWWIADDGYADMRRAGVLRWFIRSGERIVWADGPEELIGKFPDELPKSVTFIPASVFDNKILLEADPGYLSNLMALPPVERARLLGDRERGGNWKIKPEAGKLYNRAWYDYRGDLPDGGTDCVYWDLAGTARDFQTKGKGPSFTAAVCIRKVDGEYFIHHVFADQIGPAEVEKQFLKITNQLAAKALFTKAKFRVRWEQEPGSAGKRESRRLVKLLDGLDAKGLPVRSDKFVRGRAFASQSEAGNVFLITAPWGESWLDHMHNQPDTPHNDIHDATTGAYNNLSGGRGQTRKAKSYQG